MIDREIYKSALGHICTGGVATIENSPIHIHFHIHTDSERVAQKIVRAINGFIKRDRHIAIEGASQLTERELQEVFVRRLTDG